MNNITKFQIQFNKGSLKSNLFIHKKRNYIIIVQKLDYFESEFEIDYKNILTEGSVNVLDRDILRAGAYLTLEKLQSEDQTKNRQSKFI